jgi:hypothetical protein
MDRIVGERRRKRENRCTYIYGHIVCKKEREEQQERGREKKKKKGE